MAMSELQREANERKNALRAFAKNYLRPLQANSNKLERRIARILLRKKGLPGNEDLKSILSEGNFLNSNVVALVKGLVSLTDAFKI